MSIRIGPAIMALGVSMTIASVITTHAQASAVDTFAESACNGMESAGYRGGFWNPADSPASSLSMSNRMTMLTP